MAPVLATGTEFVLSASVVLKPLKAYMQVLKYTLNQIVIIH
jgi:hypothetical protein